jgi:3-phenylpropionate/cinnamic acid dioxygenase small subunit
MAIEQTPDSARRLEHLLLTREIEEFLYAEAALLDERRFEECHMNVQIVQSPQRSPCRAATWAKAPHRHQWDDRLRQA